MSPEKRLEWLITVLAGLMTLIAHIKDPSNSPAPAPGYYYQDGTGSCCSCRPCDG
jgi:hypothetical protein